MQYNVITAIATLGATVSVLYAYPSKVELTWNLSQSLLWAGSTSNILPLPETQWLPSIQEVPSADFTDLRDPCNVVSKPILASPLAINHTRTSIAETVAEVGIFCGSPGGMVFCMTRSNTLLLALRTIGFRY